MIVVVAELHRSQLGKSQQEIGKIVSAVQPGKGKSPAGVAVGLGVDLDPPKISAPAPGVLSAPVDHVVGKSPGLVAQQLRVDVVEAAEVGERQVGQTEVKRVRRNARDAEVSRDVLVKGVKILRAGAGAVEVEARVVDHLAESPHVSDGDIEAAGTGSASDAGKGISQVRAGRVVVETETQIIARPTLSPALAAASGIRGAAQRLIQTDVQVVAVVERRGHKMKIRRVGSRSTHVGQRDERQQTLRDRINSNSGILQNYCPGSVVRRWD